MSTYAPSDLLAVRRLVLSSTTLAGNAVGIVGDDNHPDGYHVGNSALAAVGKLTSDYSKRESSRDRPGSDAASAIDIGQWSGKAGAAGISWLAFNRALAEACQRGDPRTADVRELIYTVDGKIVKRWDRLGIRSTGDSSHLTHTHVSFFRMSEGRRARPDNILGLLDEIFRGVTDMPDFTNADTNAWAQARRTEALVNDQPTVTDLGQPNKLHVRLNDLEDQLEVIDAKLDMLSTGGLDQAAFTAALVTALADPTVAAALAEAARQGAEAAEDT